MLFPSFFTTNEDSSGRMDVEKQGYGAHLGNELNEDKSATSSVKMPHDDVISMLEDLESKLGNVLDTHMQEVKALRKSTGNRGGWATEQAQTTGISKSYDISLKGDAETRLRIHVKHVDQFLDDYVQNVRQLQDRLKGSGDIDQHAADVKDFESIRKQFDMQLLISTFSANLIVAFFSLVKGLLIDSDRTRNLSNAGLLLSFFSISCHVFNIAIAVRGSSLCSDANFTRCHGMDYFHFALWVCEHLYMCGIYVFSANLLMMSFAVFGNLAYPAVYCGLVALGLVVMFTCRLKHMLILYRTVGKAENLMKWLGGRFCRERRN